MGRLRAIVLIVLPSILIGMFPAVPASAGVPATTTPAAAHEAPAGRTTPERIDAAVARGALSRARGNLYLAFAIARPDLLPHRFRSDTLAGGTSLLMRLHRIAARHTPLAHHIARLIGADDDTSTRAVSTPSCSGSTTALPSKVTSTHFLVTYDPSKIGAGLTLQDYVAALERAWTRQIDAFGWAPPPPGTAGGRYHVRIERLKGFFGFVSASGTHAGLVGDNTATPWNERDAYASCMVLNANLQGLGRTPRAALNATAAHEFNHALQFGYGALIGDDRPDDVFVEGAATWIEDEVIDAADDSHRYLWPSFYGSMGAYPDDPYAYWIVWRAITEPFGTTVAGGSEDVFQSFWESISRRTAENLDALRSALAEEGVSLGGAFHDAAIRLRVLRTCGQESYAPPTCLEEADAYVAEAGKPPAHGKITDVGQTYRGGIKDDFGMNWIMLPSGARYRVRLTNTSGGGQIRGSVACDDGSSIAVWQMPEVVGGGQSTSLPDLDARTCRATWLVLTNQKQNSANPSSSPTRAYTLATDPA